MAILDSQRRTVSSALALRPAASRRSTARAWRRHLSSKAVPRRVSVHCRTRPWTGCGVFLMAPSRSRLRMMTPTVCGVSSADPRQIGAGQAGIGAQHGQHDELRRGDAELGERPLHGQPRRGLGLPQQIGEVAPVRRACPGRAAAGGSSREQDFRALVPSLAPVFRRRPIFAGFDFPFWLFSASAILVSSRSQSCAPYQCPYNKSASLIT